MVWPRGFAAAGTSLDARTDRDVGTCYLIIYRMFFLSFFIHLLTGYLLEYNKQMVIVTFLIKSLLSRSSTAATGNKTNRICPPFMGVKILTPINGGRFVSRKLSKAKHF